MGMKHLDQIAIWTWTTLIKTKSFFFLHRFLKFLEILHAIEISKDPLKKSNSWYPKKFSIFKLILLLFSLDGYDPNFQNKSNSLKYFN